MKRRVAALFSLVAVGAGAYAGCGGASEATIAGSDAGSDTGIIPTADGGFDAPQVDASDAAADAPRESSVNAAEVTLQYGNCPAYKACGGDPSGKWTLSGGCVRAEVFDGARKQCDQLKERNVSIKARGLANVVGKSLEFATEIVFSADVTLPKVCIDKLPVPVPCSQLGPVLESKQAGGFDKATCRDGAGGGCECSVESITLRKATDTFTVSGTTLKTETAGDTYEYCVQGSKLEYEQTGKEKVPAVLIFGK